MANIPLRKKLKEHGIRGNPGQGLAMATWAFFIGIASVSIYGPTAHMLHKELAISGLLVGVLAGSTNLTGSLFRIPFSAAVDRYGAKIPMLILLFLSILGILGLVLLLKLDHHITHADFGLMLILGLFAGSGAASFSVGATQSSYWTIKKEQGVALGIFGGLGDLSPGIFALILPFLVAMMGLADSYLAWLCFLVAGTVIYLVWGEDAPYFQLWLKKKKSPEEAKKIALTLNQELFPRGSTWKSLWKSMANIRVWALVYMYWVCFGGFLALVVWLPFYWTQHFHVDMREAGVVAALGFAIFAGFTRVLGGFLTVLFRGKHEKGGETLGILASAIVIIGALFLVFGTTFSASVIGEILLAFGMGFGNAATYRMIPLYEPHYIGGASGLVGGLGAFGGFVLPPIMGIFVDSFGKATGYSLGFWIFVAMGIAALIVMILLYLMPPANKDGYATVPQQATPQKS